MNQDAGSERGHMNDVIDLSIENVVASTDIGVEISLDALAMDLEGADYDPERFPGLVYRTQDPKGAALIFRSGKVVCTGSKSVDDVNKSLNIVRESLRELGLEIEDNEVEVQNIVSSVDLGTPMNLNALAIGLGLESVEYEPEQFPGLVYRLEDVGVVILIFGSGKAVVTGAKTIENAYQGVEIVQNKITELGLD